MHHNHQEKLKEASILITRHLGLEVTAATIHGSCLRGFNDPNSDIDMCFLLNRPVSDYMSMSNTPFFEGNIDDRRKRTTELSAKLTRELGWPVMLSLLDMRSLLRGIMNSSTFSLMAYERFAAENKWVAGLFDSVAKEYFNAPNLVFRCGEHISQSIKVLQGIPAGGMEYKQERTFLGTLWSTHRIISYINGDRRHCRTVNELVEYNRGVADQVPSGFDPKVLGVIRARTERSPFEPPRGVSSEAIELLKTFVMDTLKVAHMYLRANPKKAPSVYAETSEMIDLYGQLLDAEEDKRFGSSATTVPVLEELDA